MKRRTLIFCGLLVVSGASRAGDFYVRFDESVPVADKIRLQQTTNARRIRAVPSLGSGYEVWRSGDDAATISQKFEADNRVSVHGSISSDYRDLFTDVSPAMDLSPQIARNLQAIKSAPTTKDVRVVQIKSPDLTASMLINGFGETDGFSRPGTLRLNLFPGVNAVAIRRSVQVQGDNKVDWSGVVVRTADQPANRDSSSKGTALLSVNNGNVIGRVTVGNEVYRITPLGNGFHAIAKIDPRKFPPEHPPSQKRLEEGSSVKPSSQFADRAPIKNADGTMNDVPPAPVITVGIAYSKAAMQALGAQTVQDFSDALVRITNKSYANSAVQAKLVLAGATVLDYAETDWDTDLAAVVAGNQAPFTELHQWRKTIGANVVVVIVTLEGYCGLAGAILATKDTAYALVNQGCALDNLSFPHEIGHLQGARHDADAADKPYPYGHGYAYKGNWRTIMAYDGDCNCNREPYWANPNIKLNGVPMGTVDRNFDARVLSETASLLSTLRP